MFLDVNKKGFANILHTGQVQCCSFKFVWHCNLRIGRDLRDDSNRHDKSGQFLRRDVKLVRV